MSDEAGTDPVMATLPGVGLRGDVHAMRGRLWG
jgi:hypothetical protein